MSVLKLKLRHDERRVRNSGRHLPFLITSNTNHI
jgi:hypothetical protein